MKALLRHFSTRARHGWATCAILLVMGFALDALIAASLGTPV